MWYTIVDIDVLVEYLVQSSIFGSETRQVQVRVKRGKSMAKQGRKRSEAGGEARQKARRGSSRSRAKQGVSMAK